jgi:hypothetical protein
LLQPAKSRGGDLRSLLEAHERRKLKFMPQPTRHGLKFSNKSEEERYLRVCSKIISLEFMDPASTEQVYLHIQKFLSEYLFRFWQAAQVSDYAQAGQFVVDSRHVRVFIEAVRELQATENKR